jgi:hypothetical protein
MAGVFQNSPLQIVPISPTGLKCVSSWEVFVTSDRALLKAADVPSQTASWTIIGRFALTFDGYEAIGGSQCGELANGANREFVNNPISIQNLSLTEARACLFFEQRRFHHLGCEPEREERVYINTLLDTIRNKIKE